MLRAPIGAVVAARVSVLAAARAALGSQESQVMAGTRLVDPTAVRGPGEVMVDNVAAPTQIIDEGDLGFDGVTRALADARARRLLEGRGPL
jgi:hypothetical protein